jgi:hypothetical protein
MHFRPKGSGTYKITRDTIYKEKGQISQMKISMWNICYY